MKKLIFAILLFCCLFLEPCFAQRDISVYIDNENIELDQKPVIVADRLLVPMREIFEYLDSNVEWIDESRVILATKQNIIIALRVSTPKLIITNVETNETKVIALDTAPQIFDNTTYVPIRAIAESFGMQVYWNAKHMKVEII